MERTPRDASVTATRGTSTQVLTPSHSPGGEPGNPWIYIGHPYVPILDFPGRLTSLINSSQLMTDNTPRIPDAMDMQRLQAMQVIAKMKESAERHGIGFIGGFISPNGEKFVMTNMTDDDDINALMPEDLK